MKTYRNLLMELKLVRRSKYPYLADFFKQLRINEIKSEFVVEVKPLLVRLNKSLSYPKSKPNLDNLSLQEIYELKRAGKISYSDYLNAEIRESKKIKLRAEKILDYPKITELNDFDNSFEVKTTKESRKKVDKTDYSNYQKKAYLCEKCNRFHRYLHQGKPSKTHKAHYKFFKAYKDQIPNYQLFKIDFKRKWKQAKNYKV